MEAGKNLPLTDIGKIKGGDKLQYVQDSSQFHSELSQTAASSLRAVLDSGQSHSVLSRTVLSDWDNVTLLSSIIIHFHSTFILDVNHLLLITHKS